MNSYKISCYSRCGSYFGSYLQSVTVIADSKEAALIVTKDWLKKEGERFIYPEEKWRVEVLETGITNGMVVDYHQDSDY